MIRQFLNDMADETCECSDGGDALSAYTEFRPDWTLMDWEMERVDGLTATREIIAAYPEAKIALVTGHDDIWLRDAAAEAGAIDYVPKENLNDLGRLFGLVSKSGPIAN